MHEFLRTESSSRKMPIEQQEVKEKLLTRQRQIVEEIREIKETIKNLLVTGEIELVKAKQNGEEVLLKEYRANQQEIDKNQ